MSTRRILIIEDNEKSRKLFRDLLQVAGYETLESDSAEEGLELARRHAPALVIMDVHLPGMSGLEALARLRGDAHTRTLPVIAVTASAMTHDEDKVIAAGFDGYQRKPVHIKEFLALVRRTLEPQG